MDFHSVAVSVADFHFTFKFVDFCFVFVRSSVPQYVFHNSTMEMEQRKKSNQNSIKCG